MNRQTTSPNFVELARRCGHTTPTEVEAIWTNRNDPHQLAMWRRPAVDAVLSQPEVDPDGYFTDRLKCYRDGYDWS